MGTANEKMCEGMNDAASQPLGTTPGEREHADPPWSCAVCTYHHGGAESSCLSCSMCSTPRSKGFRCPCCHLAFASNDELMDHHLEVCGLPPDDADHYTVLGLTKAKHLTADDIKRAYRLLSLRIHPDRAAVREHLDEDGPIKSGKLMMRVNEAYKVLGDPSSRKDYDRRGSCIHQAVMYAKHQHKGAPGRFELRNGMSGHKVDPRELLLGDHVYYYMPDMLMGMYQHHGIVSYVGGTGGATDNDSVPDIMIIDFGIGNRNRAATKKMGNVRRVREVPLRGDGGFLPAKTTLMRARYGESSWQHNLGFGASYKDLPDEPKTTVLRARRLLCLGNADYDALENSCETIAFFCKTGLRYTGQTTKTSNVLAATGGATGLTGVLFAGASGAGTFDVTTVAAFGVTVGASLTWVAVVATGVVLIGAAGMTFYRRCKRRQLKGTQSLEAIAAMTKLRVRERAHDRGGMGGRHYSIASTRTAGRLDNLTKNLCSAPGVEVDVSDRMEQAAEIVKSGMLDAQDEAEAERAASRTKRRSAEMETKGEAEKSKGEATSKAQSHAAIGADELLPWILSVLEQCEIFNAILDLPDVTDRGGETAFYCTHLKAAEVELAELDPESSVVRVFVSMESASDDSVTSSEVNSPLMSNQSTNESGLAVRPQDTNGWGGGAPFVREDEESRRSQSRSEKAHAAAWGDHGDGRPFESDPEVKSAERGGFVVKAVFKNGNVVVSRKTAKEFLMLHRELSMAHRNARDLALPQVRTLPTRHLGGYRRPRRDDATEYASYLGKCLALITAEHMDGVGLGDYLAHLEDVNVDRAIRSFLHTGCEVVELKFDKGALGLKLKHEDKVRVVVSSFERAWADLAPGPAEQSKLVCIGDEIIAVNGQAINGRDFKGALEMLKTACWPMTLRFSRKGVPTRPGGEGGAEMRGAASAEGQGQGQGQGAPALEPTDAHMPVGLPGTQDAINLDTYDADADVEEEEAAAVAAVAAVAAAGASSPSAGGEGSDEEDNLEPGDDGLPWVLPDASWFQDPSQGGATAGSDEGGEGGEGDEGAKGAEANKRMADPSRVSMSSLEEPVLGEHDFEPVDPPADDGHGDGHGDGYGEDTAAIAASLNDSDADLSRGAAKAATAEAAAEAAAEATTAEAVLAPAPVLEPWVLDPLDPSLGEQLLDEAASYMHAYSADLTDGKLTPEVVRAILSQTGLPFSTLKDVWELADIDKDGLFDEVEFALALFLCRRVVNGALLPQTLHPTLIPPSKR